MLYLAYLIHMVSYVADLYLVYPIHGMPFLQEENLKTAKNALTCLDSPLNNLFSVFDQMYTGCISSVENKSFFTDNISLLREYLP